MQTLTIQGIESKMTKTGNTKVVLICQEGKFYFYRQTKTGISKAQEQFNKYLFKIGDIVEAEVQTEDKTFTNTKGEEITYKDNWIKFFAEIEGIQVVKTSPEATKSSTSPVPIEYDTKTLQDRVTALEERIEAMSKWAAGIENKIKAHDALLIDLRGETAVELHSSFEQHAGIDNIDLEPKKFDFKKAKDLLQDPSNAPLEIETPENLVDKNF